MVLRYLRKLIAAHLTSHPCSSPIPLLLILSTSIFSSLSTMFSHFECLCICASFLAIVLIAQSSGVVQASLLLSPLFILPDRTLTNCVPPIHVLLTSYAIQTENMFKGRDFVLVFICTVYWYFVYLHIHFSKLTGCCANKKLKKKGRVGLNEYLQKLFLWYNSAIWKISDFLTILR